MRGYRPAAEIVAIGETAGEDDQIALWHSRVAVPDADRLVPGDESQRGANVALAVRARKDHNSGSHRDTCTSTPLRYSNAGSRSSRSNGGSPEPRPGTTFGCVVDRRLLHLQQISSRTSPLG